jgi:hypothetical protein
MHDPHSSEIVVQAEIQYRRRLLTSLRRASPVLEPQARLGLRAVVAEALAHLALHLDGRSIGAVAEHHAPTAGHSHGRPA